MDSMDSMDAMDNTPHDVPLGAAPQSGRSAESAKHTSPGQAALKARAALGSAPIMAVFLGPFGPSRRS